MGECNLYIMLRTKDFDRVTCEPYRSTVDGAWRLPEFHVEDDLASSTVSNRLLFVPFNVFHVFILVRPQYLTAP
jgi:hypothetical protein